MTLQGSGAISLANVQTEFGGSNPIGINEYYAAAAGVPGSGTISLYDFYGKAANAFVWSENMLGYRTGVSNNYTLTGNTVTPGSGNSPRNFVVNVSKPFISPYGTASVTYYQGGSLNTTWESTGAGADISVGVTLTFGGSSIRFDSYVNDLSTYNDLYSYAQVLVTDVVPYQLQLMYHAFNLGGGGFYYDSGD